MPASRGRPAVASGSSCYVPNGRSLDHEHYQYKLRWLDRLVGDLDGHAIRDDGSSWGLQHLPGRHRLLGSEEVRDGDPYGDQAERDRLAALEQWGLVDVFRDRHPEERLYSWWDYRGGSFYKKMGLRIDLLMTSRSVTGAASFMIDRNEYKGPKDDPPLRPCTGLHRRGTLTLAVRTGCRRTGAGLDQLLVLSQPPASAGQDAALNLPSVIGQLGAGVILGPSIFRCGPMASNGSCRTRDQLRGALRRELAGGGVPARHGGLETDLGLIRRLGRAAAP